MALVREPMATYDGGFVDAEASAFDALGYGGAGGHDALLGGLDAAALFDFGAYGYTHAHAHAHGEPAGAFAQNSASWAGAGPSLLTFDRAARSHGGQAAVATVVADEEADCDEWIDAMDEDDQAAPGSTIGFDPASGCFSLTQRSGGARRPFGLLFPGTGTGSSAGAPPARISQKRTKVVRMQLDAEPRAAKRQCGASRKASKPKAPAAAATTTSSPNKDPQSLAAKNRREKISERLRTLQELVPNGTKVDMVTMLEKAISYVKFLQLQVKVLATDEFWPAQQGGMAPEISQVKEALDAILSSSPSPSQRGAN